MLLRPTRPVLAVLLFIAAPCDGDVFVVNNTADPGDGVCAGGGGCTFREAIMAASASPGADVITFDIPGNGPHLILPQSPLPPVTGTVTINGSSQPGFAGTPLIEIGGDVAGFEADGLVIAGDSSFVGWLAISAFDGNGIEIDGDSNTIVGCYVGLTASGGTGFPNGDEGILVRGFSDENVIGGSSALERNVISNNLVGIKIEGAALDNAILGNYIGLDPTGSVAAPNPFGGVSTSGEGTIIGGSGSGEGNVISGNVGMGGAPGIAIVAAADGSTVKGNLIGTNAAGTSTVGNFDGILVGSSFVVIGGAFPGDGNVIAGNLWNGIRVLGTAIVDIVGNSIGLDAAGGAAGNQWAGLLIEDSSAIDIVGNTIAHNQDAGIMVAAGIGNRFSVNAIYDNGALGIDLGGDGVTQNDPGDADDGPNGLFNAPELTSATAASAGGTSVLVAGTWAGLPNTDVRIEFYVSDGCDPSGHGEGQAFIGAISAVPGGPGVVTFQVNFDLPSPASASDAITTLAIDQITHDTSEFSNCVPIDVPVCGAGGSCFAVTGGPGCADMACCEAVCALDPFCCASAWDGLCVEAALGLCGGCGDPASGDCFSANGTPGCADFDCCAAVCVVDVFCCETAWDQICAGEADSMCETPSCPADCASPPDGVVNVDDLLALLSAWGAPGGCDLDGDGAVDVDDMLILLGAWGSCP